MANSLNVSWPCLCLVGGTVEDQVECRRSALIRPPAIISATVSINTALNCSRGLRSCRRQTRCLDEQQAESINWPPFTALYPSNCFNSTPTLLLQEDILQKRNIGCRALVSLTSSFTINMLQMHLLLYNTTLGGKNKNIIFK